MAKKKKGVDIPLAMPPKEEEIPMDEQWRLINESGLLAQKIPRAADAPIPSPVEAEQDTADEIFFAAMLIIPFTFLYLAMDM